MRFGRVLVGMDFSAASLAAARWAARSFAPDAEIVLVHVLRDAEAPPWLRARTAGLEALHDEVTPSLRGGLRGLAELIHPGRVRTEIRTGATADALAAAAEEFDADLVCLGQARTRRGSARFGATTAHRVLGRSDRPVVVVPAAHSESLDRVLVAVEESLALQLTREWLVATLERSGVPAARAEVHARIGDPGQEIIAVANATAADLVVMGRRGSPAPRRLHAAGNGDARRAVGSTARFIAWASPCPVLVLPEHAVDAPPPPGGRERAGIGEGRNRLGRHLPDVPPLRPTHPPLPPAAALRRDDGRVA